MVKIIFLFLTLSIPLSLNAQAESKTIEQLVNELDNKIPSRFFYSGYSHCDDRGAIGTLYLWPPETWWVVPNELFTHVNSGSFPTFDWHMSKNQSSIPKPPETNRDETQVALGLKLHLDERYMIIPCSQISCPDN